MGESPAQAIDPRATPDGPLEGARALFRASEAAEAGAPRERYIEQLTAYLTYVEDRRAEFAQFGEELGHQLEETSLAFYRLGQTDLAGRAIDVGLTIAPSFPALLYRKAQMLLATNKEASVAALPLLEQAVRLDPNNKAIWGTLGDALKLQGRSPEATEAYLKAQELDPTTTQYVEKAIRLSPNHPGAQRRSLQLAKAHGGAEQALQTCEALLTTSPNDPELLFAHVELLAELGQVAAALDAIAPARAARPGDPRLALIAGRLHLAAGQRKDALDEFRLASESSARLEPAEVAELAERIESTGESPELAIAVREELFTREPRNVANLHALRQLAQRTRRFDLGISTCQKLLEISPGNLEATRALAEFQLTSGRLDEGFTTYRALIAANPHEVGEIRRAADAARAANRADDFREFAERVLSEDPHDVAVREQLAQSFAAAGAREPALALYESLLETTPTESRYLWETKRLLTELGRTAELPTIYDRLYEADPANTRLAYERAAIYLGLARAAPEGTPERAESARRAVASYERASADPKIAEESLLGLAQAARLAGDPARSIRAYEEFLEKPGHEGNALVLKELGQARFDFGQFAEADEAFQKALEHGLEDPDLLWGASEALLALHQEARALQFVDILARRHPAELRYQRRRGQLLLRLGKVAEGAAVLREAAGKAPKDAEVQFDTALALRSAGAYADAVEFFGRGLDSDPTSRSGRLGLAETYNLAGRYNETVPVVDGLLNDEPNDLAAWRARADACRALGRTSDLEYSLKAILLLDPTHAPTLVEKYRLHLSQGEKAEAFECLSDFLEADGPESHNPELLLEAGDLAAELGKVEEANREYERAQALDPAQATAIGLRRARLRLSAGRPDLALELLDTAAKHAPDPGAVGIEFALERAEILMLLERPGEAETEYRAILGREPGSVPASLGLARALLDQGKPAEAKELLQGTMPKGVPVSGLYLLLAEAESALGSVPRAAEVIQKGVEALPDSTELWTRLGELAIARGEWTDASKAFREAIQRDAGSAELLLRAGFVAERRGQATEALALYERATQIAPTNKFAWTSRGVALLSNGRPDEATASFDRALAVDPEFEAARQGKKTALDRAREQKVDRYGREALLLEARLHRSVTKNDLFVSLHVPFELLEPVLTTLSRDPQVDLSSLSEEALHDLEVASCQVVTAALERRAEGVERRGFSLADVAVLSPPTRSLSEIQRLFGYLRAVLEVDLRPENLKLTPDVEELARKALLLPPDQRGLFQLVRDLRVGLFKARLIKAVESAGAAVHAPLPSLDLGPYAAELENAARPLPPEGDDAAELEAPRPVHPAPHGRSRPAAAESAPPASPPARPVPSQARCVGCGGLASIVHSCGAPVCAHCIAEFGTCPKCRQPASWPSNPSAAGPGAPATSDRAIPAPSPSPHKTPSGGTLHTLRQVVAKSKTAAAKPAPPAKAATSEPEARGKAAASPPTMGEAAAKPKVPPHPARPKDPTDDEPRL